MAELLEDCFIGEMVNAMVMIRVLMIAVSAVAGSWAQRRDEPQPERDSRLRCVTALTIPSFSNLAERSKGGWAEAVVSLGSNGGVKAMNVLASHPGVKEEVSIYLQMAQFSKSCKNVDVSIRFEYHLEGEPAYNPLVRVVFKAPNSFQLFKNPTAPSNHR